MRTLIDVYGFFGTICGYWGAQGESNLPPWMDVPELAEVTFDKIDKLIFTNYGDRPISRYLREYVKLSGDGQLSPTNAQIVANYVLDVCRLSWARLTADFAADYNPAENYSMTETETGNDTESGSDDTERTYDDYKETEKLGHTVETDDGSNIYGFDNNDTTSPDGAKSEKDKTTTTYGKNTDSGDTREIEGSHKDTTTYGHKLDRTRTLTRAGNIGTLTSTAMIRDDTAYWSAENFFDRVAADIAAILTIPIYE